MSLNKLQPATRKVVEKCIDEVIQEYAEQDNKYFTADVLAYLRTKITSLVHERLGSDEIARIDVGLDLNDVEMIKFFFRVDIPQEKVEDHLLRE
jgi:hypothetical protein